MMQKQISHLERPLKMLAGTLFVLGTCTSQHAMAKIPTDTSFTNASLKGSYVYINSSGNVGSFGPITFDGSGKVKAALEISLPCTTPGQNCTRNIVNSTGTGTYSVRPDGTGVASINLSTGAVTYRFIISKAEEENGRVVATQVFAVLQNGGLAGQLVTPTWMRRSD